MIISFSTLSSLLYLKVSLSKSTSHVIWHALEDNFSSRSHAKIMQIRTQLANATKGSKTATEYFLFIEKLTDELVIASKPMTCEDVITYVLARLGHEYGNFVASILAQTDTVTLEEIYSLILTT